jgi:hypothetical protein
VLEELALSYRIAAQHLRGDVHGPVKVVRYEDLVADTAGSMRGVAEILGIEPAASLLTPTVAGLPASRNSSFADRSSAGRGMLSRAEREQIAAIAGPAAAALDYVV